MQQLSPSYFHFLDLPVTHELKNPAPSLQTREEIIEFFPKRVSEKLLQNRLRKLEIEQKKHKQKELLVQKRVAKQRGIFQLFRTRELEAQQRRESKLRADSIEAPLKELHEDEHSLQKLSKFHASEAIITKCRQKVEQKKQQYVARIQTRTRERQQKAQLRRRQLRENMEKANDEIHLEEWRQYETQILQRRKEHSPPDRLYQEYKKRKQQVDSAVRGEHREHREDREKQNVEVRHAGLQKASSEKTAKFRSRRVQYFGVHEGDAMKKTENDMGKMRKFIEDHCWATQPLKDEQLLLKFEHFLCNHLLQL